MQHDKMHGGDKILQASLKPNEVDAHAKQWLQSFAT